MNKQLQVFFENTQQLHIFLCFILFIIITWLFIPTNMKFTRIGVKLLIIGILGYILYHNFIETRKFSQKQIVDENSIETAADLKNNIIANYTLCGFILLLMVYIIL